MQPIIILKEMQVVRGGKKSNNEKKKHAKVTNDIKVPFGKSCIDYLPDAMAYSIYYYKHQL